MRGVSWKRALEGERIKKRLYLDPVEAEAVKITFNLYQLSDRAQ